MTAQIISLDAYRKKHRHSETRTPWGDFPSIFIMTPLGTAKDHEHYDEAKSKANLAAGYQLAKDIIPNEKLDELRQLISSRKPYILPVFGLEELGKNTLPLATAAYLSAKLELSIWEGVVQANRPERTGKGAFYRLAHYPFFDGEIEQGADYIILDDTLSMGGTLASLKGFVENQGGRVILGVALTGHAPSASITLTEKMYNSIMSKHGEELDEWWKAEVGFGLDKLTQGEAGHLRKAPTIEEIRNRIAEGRSEGQSAPA